MIDGGTGMVLAQKKFPTCVYIVHTLDNLHYSQQGYAFLINWNLVLGHGHTRQFFVTFTAIFPSCKLNLEFRIIVPRYCPACLGSLPILQYIVIGWMINILWGGGAGRGTARAVNDVGWEPIGHQEVGNHRKQYFPRARLGIMIGCI